jgi:hypothetical protein
MAAHTSGGCRMFHPDSTRSTPGLVWLLAANGCKMRNQ